MIRVLPIEEAFKTFMELPDPTDWVIFGLSDNEELLLYGLVYNICSEKIQVFGKTLHSLNSKIKRICINPFCMGEQDVINIKQEWQHSLNVERSFICHEMVNGQWLGIQLDDA